MSDLWVRGLEHIHGHIGWLAAVALAHPAILLRRRRRRALLAAASATGLVTVAAALGATIYPAFRVDIKPRLFAHEPAMAWAFERKEHLAVAALAMAWVGLGAHLAEYRSPAGVPGRLDRVAFFAYVAATGAALVTATLGVAVATHRTF